MDTKPHWHHAAEHVIECLERYTTMMDPECTCGLCPECGKIPADCSGTECAKTCQCSPCDHCMATWAIAGLRDAMVTPNAEVSRGVLEPEKSAAGSPSARPTC